MKYYAKVTLIGVFELESSNMKDAEKELADNFNYLDERFDVEEQNFEIVEEVDGEEN